MHIQLKDRQKVTRLGARLRCVSHTHVVKDTLISARSVLHPTYFTDIAPHHVLAAFDTSNDGPCGPGRVDVEKFLDQLEGHCFGRYEIGSELSLSGLSVLSILWWVWDRGK